MCVPWYITCLVWAGSAQGSPSHFNVPKNSNGRCPNGLILTRSSSGSTLISELCTLSLRLRRNSFWMLLFSFSFFLWLPKAPDHRWVLELLLTGKLSLLAQLPLHHNGLVKCPHYFWSCTNLPVGLSLTLTLTHAVTTSISHFNHSQVLTVRQKMCNKGSHPKFNSSAGL